LGRAVPLAILTVWSGLLCAGCNGALSPEAQRLLQDARQASAAGDDRAVLRHADAFLAAHGGTSAVAEVLYLRGLAGLRTGRTDAAGQDLQRAARLAETEELRAKALSALGDLQYDSGQWPLALESYAAALAQDAEPRPDGTDRALYRLGELLQRQGRWAEADEQFDRLVHLYEGSAWARRAAGRIRGRAWTLLVAAHADRSRAEALAEQLRAAGRPAEVRAALIENRPEFRVQSGRYPTYDQAAKALADVRRDAPRARVSPTR